MYVKINYYNNLYGGEVATMLSKRERFLQVKRVVTVEPYSLSCKHVKMSLAFPSWNCTKTILMSVYIIMKSCGSLISIYNDVANYLGFPFTAQLLYIYKPMDYLLKFLTNNA